jgi:sugar fermentation stimulation protein A
MEFSSSLIQGTLIQRYKRFLADVQLADGTVVTAHCPNTGAMTGCAQPGWQVWLSPSTNPKRKLSFTWEIAFSQEQHWIGINTHRANALVKEAIMQGNISELSGYQSLKGEVKFGQENSRIDFLLQDPNKVDCYLEVKSVTLLHQGKGYFPDSKTLRGQKHLRELRLIAEQGKRAVLVFCVQHTGIKSVEVAAHIDGDYGQEYQAAIASGVEVLCYGCKINPEKIYINQTVKLLPLNTS